MFNLNPDLSAKSSYLSLDKRTTIKDTKETPSSEQVTIQARGETETQSIIPYMKQNTAKMDDASIILGSSIKVNEKGESTSGDHTITNKSNQASVQNLVNQIGAKEFQGSQKLSVG